ncbi:hypothetical protein OESDEN_19003 [Oesophagostomum dentatum]|uniref:Carboxylesterase type B domain-containing protein n=1 Tax=Oesophagostomum dentatum TaxID=61180 RepID=A0A0B1SBP3_OESDE|nr:hypothetical protein OESDEN_19003 [Oesophagostomum dentatum]
MISIILPVLLLSKSTIITAQNYVTVSTNYGVIQGQRVDYGNDKNQLYYGQADVFLGIPYAQPPTGTLRFRVGQEHEQAVHKSIYWFQAPVQLNSSNQIYDATYYRPKCPQLYAGDYVNEDCLYLNVYAPAVRS